MYSKAELIEAVKKHGSQRKAAKALGMGQATLNDHIAGKYNGVAKPKVDPKGKSLAEFRAQHDKSFIVPKRIKEGLAALGSGWEYEVQFAKIAGISLADLSNFREQFADNFVVVGRSGKRAWTGSKATAQAMREMVL